MPLPFATWTIDQARKAAALGTDVQPLIDSIRKFYDGDHWQEGTQWIGPHPQPTETGAADIIQEIAAAFVSRNVIKEVTDRHARGVIGQEPDWGFTPRRSMKNTDKPTADEQKEIDLIEAVLTEWWNDRKAHTKFKEVVTLLIQAQRALLRLYVPKGLLTEVQRTTTAADGQQTTTTVKGVSVTPLDNEDGGGALRAALEKIFIDVPQPEVSAIYTDPSTQIEVGIVIYKPNAGAIDSTDQTEVAELTWVDEAGVTQLRTISQSKDTTAGPTFSLDLGRHILLGQMLRKPLITDQVVQQQRALNLALTMVPRNVTAGGFLERVMLNAQMPGVWVDENGEPATDMAQRKRFVPGAYKAGAGSTSWIRGIDYTDPKDDSLKITDPSVQFKEPSPVAPMVDAKRSHYVDILEEVDQVHILLGADATPSGRSREEARSDYVSGLNDTKDPTENAGRWLLETVLAFAEALSGKPNVLTTKYRATFECRINAGPIDPIDRAADETSVEKGTMAPETAMQRAGILDVDAENARINASPRGKLDTLKRQFEVMASATGTGLSLEAAAEIVIDGKDPMTVIRKDVAKAPTPPENLPGPPVPPAGGGNGQQPPGRANAPPANAPAAGAPAAGAAA